MSGLLIHNIHKSFGKNHALAGVSFQVEEGEIVAVLGPSGCGKSTLLNIIAGLELPDQGDISWNNVSLVNIPPHKRGFGLMFQDFALFPHRNVFENVAFGLRMVHQAKEKIDIRVDEVLELVGLPDFAERDVNTLSGGESQRVALARSLAPSPRMLMLDEPLGSLDRTLRERLILDLKQILEQNQLTALYVTHDQEEAFVIADRVVVMNVKPGVGGVVEQIGLPQDIYRNPGSVFVAHFLGLNNLFPGEVSVGGNGKLVTTPIGTFPIIGDARGRVTMLLRPDSVKLNSDGPCHLIGKIGGVSFRGNLYRIMVEINGFNLLFDFPTNSVMPNTGDQIELSFEPDEAIQILLK